jgi:hypothetical protein
MTTNAPGATPDDLDLAAPLVTDADVLQRVDLLVDQECRQRRTLWLVFVTSVGAQLPVVVPVDHLPEWPEQRGVANLCFILANVIDNAAPGASAIITLTRPGDPEFADADRAWFRALTQATQARATAIRMLCLATESGVHQVTPGDLLLTTPAISS